MKEKKKETDRKATAGDVCLSEMDLPGLVIMHCHNKTKQFNTDENDTQLIGKCLQY